MNALADYILDWRPKCDVSEVFVTVKAPYRSLLKGFGSMIDKYCEKAGIHKIALRGFTASAVPSKPSWSHVESLLRLHLK